MIKKILSISLAAALFVSSCSIVNQKADRDNLGDTNWKLIAINQNRENLGQSAILEFDEKDSEIKGEAACNSFKGDYELIRNLISFSGIITTKMYCEGKMDKENEILNNLQKVSRFEVKSNRLYLYSKDELLLTYKR